MLKHCTHLIFCAALYQMLLRNLNFEEEKKALENGRVDVHLISMINIKQHKTENIMYW